MSEKYSGMFGFANRPDVELMLKMAKERHAAEEIEALLQRFEKTDSDEFIALCKTHQFEGMVASFLKKNEYPMSEEWTNIYDRCYRFAAEKWEASKQICRMMNENGIDMVLLKNGGILADIIDDPAKMPMGDIDTLVHRDDFLRAHQIMLDEGYVFEYSNEYEIPDIQNAYRDGDAEYVKMIADDHKLIVEVAWRVVAGRWMRPDCEPNTDEAIANSHHARDGYIGVLSPVDNLLQVCIHTAKHSYLRAPGLRLNLDVERIVNHTEIDWEIFLQKVKQAHTKTAAYYSLYIPSVLFDTPVPAHVLDALRPKANRCRRIEKMLTKAGFLNPKERKFNKIEFLFFQTALYDSFTDMWRTLYPDADWMKMRYDFKSNWLIPYYIIVRGLDLVGIRKKQK